VNLARLGRTVLSIAVLAAAWPVLANTSSGRGLVVDNAGNPLADVTVTFRNTASDKAVYATKTNKKGRFVLDGLLYYETGRWIMTAELEGWVATHMKVESRTETAVVGKTAIDLSPDKKPMEIIVRPFGVAEVEFTMTPRDQWEASRTAAPAAPVAAGEVPEGAVAAPAQEDDYARAFRLAKEGDLDGSAEAFAKAKPSAAADPDLLEGYANVLYRLKRYPEAAAEASAAIAVAPERLNPRRILYSAQVSREDWAGAAETLTGIAELKPDDPWVLEQRAFLAARSGDSGSAIAAFEAMSAADPNNVEAWVALGGLYADAGQLAKSEAAYRKVVEIDPSNAYQTFYNLGALLQNKPNPTKEDTRRAIEAFRKALEIKPDYAIAHRSLGFALIGAGDLAGGRRALERYLELQPKASDAAQIRAMVAKLPK